VLVLLVAMVSEYEPRQAVTFFISILFILFLAGSLWLGWARSPHTVQLHGRELRVLRRRWWPFVVTLDDIEDVELGPRAPAE
jgi:hypothetical protein